ncbi:MAG: PAS domain-containing protein [Herminiimonas sp.]|nr:PAS domain-containing protein [Herminiimonas sp.]
MISQVDNILFEGSTDCAKILDLDGNLIAMNQNGQCLVEIDDFSTVSGTSWKDLWPDESHATITNALAAAEDGKSGHFTAFAPTVKGTPKWWDVQVTPILDREGKVERIFAVSRDVTLAHMALERQREAAVRLQFTLEAAEIGDWDLDLLTDTARCSLRHFACFGYDDIVPGWGFEMFLRHVHFDDRELVKSGVTTDDGQPTDWDIECRVIWPDRSIHWISAIGSVDRVDGVPTRILGIVTDITQRKSMEQQLRDLNETLEDQVRARTRERDSIWEVTRDLIAVISGSGFYKSVNPAWTREFGYPPEEIIGLPFTDFVHPEDHAEVEAGHAAMVSGSSVTNFEARIKDVGGSYRTIEWIMVAMGTDFYASGRDVTEQRRTEDQLRQAQKMEAIGQLTGGIAHDFNNMLAGIMGNIEMLRLKLAKEKGLDLSRYIEGALTGVQRAAALTHRLLAFSRRQTLDAKPTDVEGLILSMEDLLRRTLGPNVFLEVTAETNPLITLCDPHQLESALLNLAINGRDAMPDGGRLTIASNNKFLDEEYASTQLNEVAPGPFVRISVSDTGTGMTTDVARRALDPFFTTKPIGQGTGLGLSMVYGFIKQSRGHLRIQSEPGRGTTIDLFLPWHAGKAALQEVSDAMVDANRVVDRKVMILLVEDDPAIRNICAEMLDDLGYVVAVAGDGIQALKQLATMAAIDLLITDVGLPNGLNGRQVADAARVTYPGLQVLFITGFAAGATVENDLLSAGMQVVTKPFSMTTFVNRVRSMIELQKT